MEQQHDKSYTHTNRGEAELRSIYIHPKHWNEGIGSEIMEELVKRCSVEPAALKAETYEGSDAVEFYKSKGFETVRRSKIRAAETEMSRDYRAVVLKKRL